MLTAKHLSANGLDPSAAAAVASATSGFTWIQWVQLGLAILQQIGGVIGKLPTGTTPTGP
jgi:hypothetical protein